VRQPSRRSRFPALALLAIAAAPVVAAAQGTAPHRHLALNQYLDWEQVSDPQISPDGTAIVYTRSWVNQMKDAWESALWIMNADGSRNRFLVKGSSARWSPDGTRIAYLAEGESKRAQIFVRWMDAEGATSQVTRTEHPPEVFRWSPDGRQIAFTMFVPESTPWPIAMPTPPEGAEWTKPPRMEDRVHFRLDRVGFLEDGTYHLFVVPAVGGAPRQLTHSKGVVGAPSIGFHLGAGFDWTPDGRSIVFDGLMRDGWDEVYLESYIYAVDVASGDIRQLVTERGPWSEPTVSPDGRNIVFVGYPWSHQTYHARDLYVMGIDGAGMHKITGDLDRDPADVTWAPDGKGVYFTAEDEGTSNVYVASLAGAVHKVTEGDHMLSLGSASRDGAAVGVRTTFHQPPDVVRYSLRHVSGLSQLTHVNDDVLAGIELGAVEEIRFQAKGGPRAQGWVVKPPEFDPSRHYPLVLVIHGGPHAMYNVGFDFAYQDWAANGYVVLYANPRGSTGYGTAFGDAIDNAYPGVDYDDLMAAVDTVTGRGYIDTARMFVYGCSGGGLLTSWVIGHTTRFAAAGVLCPVIDWLSFAGTSDVVRWGYERFPGYPWTNPQPFLEHSPLMYAGNVKTPTVIMSGELDLRTPTSQAEEFYQALKAVGVPTVLLRFRREFHGTTSKPTNFIRTQLYLRSWFQRWAGGEAAKSRKEP
jgi:dipeptidyl aminopeptidase/acylaminoacyl peptidase